MSMSEIGWSISAFLPGALAVAWAKYRVWRHRGASVDPLDRTPLGRLPGERLLLQKEDLNLDMAMGFMGLVIFSPIVVALGLAMSPAAGALGSAVVWCTTMLFFTLPLGLGFCRLADRYISCCLGYRGEVFVAQCLARLACSGARIYHDLQMEAGGRKFNIDHVVVAASGVYAIETKTHRKPKGQKGDGGERGRDGRSYRVTYDGTRLIYAPGIDRSEELRQAEASAAALRSLLGNRAPVFGVLAVKLTH